MLQPRLTVEFLIMLLNLMVAGSLIAPRSYIAGKVLNNGFLQLRALAFESHAHALVLGFSRRTHLVVPSYFTVSVVFLSVF